eukprot:SAG31_NODE_32493_length_355_cov_0.804688_1_plen_49_part_10
MALGAAGCTERSCWIYLLCWVVYGICGALMQVYVLTASKAYEEGSTAKK